MGQLIKERLSTILSLIAGTGTGWGFAALISAPELRTWLITIAIAMSLLISLIISVSILGQMTIKRRERYIKKLVRIFITLFFAIAIFFVLYQKYTITIPWAGQLGNRTDTVIVKGLFYSPTAKNYREIVKKNDPNKAYPADAVLLDDAAYNIQKVWPDDSRTYARLVLLLTYTIMIGLFIAGITLTTEIITRSRKKSNE